MTYLQIREGRLIEARDAYNDRIFFKQRGFRFDGTTKGWQKSLETLTPETLDFLARWIDLSIVRDMVNALKGLGEKGRKVIGYMLASSRYAAYRSLIQQLAPEAANPTPAAPAPAPAAPAAPAEDEKAVLEAARQAGVSLFPHQVAAAVKMLKAHRSGEKAFLLADAPRVGKTFSILAFLKVTNQPATVLCPASVVGMWNDQLTRWGVKGFAVSYDTFRSQYEKKYKNSVAGVLVLDEAHRVKNARAKITTCVATEAKNASFVIAATGTPFQNEPAELLTVLKTSQISDYKSVYIAAEWRQERYGRRLVWKSVAAMKAFRDHLEASSWYLRRELKDVAAHMPKLVRESLVINADNLNKHLAKIDQELEALYHQYMSENRHNLADKVANVRAGLFSVEDLGALFPIASTLRRLLASAKLAAIESVVEDALEQVEEGEGVLFFAHHAEVIEKLKKALAEVPHAVIDGSVDAAARKAIADAFQKGELKALILSTRAAGEGLTLSRAALAIFIELDWNPAALTQAENRLMNINDARTKIARYIVAPHPLEQRMVELINDKAISAEIVYASKNSIAKIENPQALSDDDNDDDPTPTPAGPAGEDGVPPAVEAVEPVAEHVDFVDRVRDSVLLEAFVEPAQSPEPQTQDPVETPAPVVELQPQEPQAQDPVAAPQPQAPAPVLEGLTVPPSPAAGPARPLSRAGCWGWV